MGGWLVVAGIHWSGNNNKKKKGLTRSGYGRGGWEGWGNKNFGDGGSYVILSNACV